MKLLELFGDRVKANEPLKNHTTYRIGGPADLYLSVDSADEAVRAVKAARADGLPIFVLGGGSNILVSDAGFRGLVLSCGARKIKIEGDRLIADAGAVTFLAVKRSAEAGLAGLEWAAGIPGTIGGAIRGNAGAYGGEMKDAIATVEAVDLRSGEMRTFDRRDCLFGYRDSVFKREPWLVLRAALALSPGDRDALVAKLAELTAKRRENLPLEHGSAGCCFKNIIIAELPALPERLRDILPSKYQESGRIPAAWLIDQAGLKGKRIGGALVSEKNCNFLVNADKATADEVMQLVSCVKMKVRDEFGVQLQEEVQYVGF